MTIVHITADYPDSFQSAKTKAIYNLVTNTAADFDHLVYSLNRQNISAFQATSRALRRGSNKWKARSFDVTTKVQSWTYQAPSKGLFMQTILNQVADQIIADLERSNHLVTLVQGHKLSIEAIIADRIAKHFNVPLAISIQGNSDQYIVSIRRDLRTSYRRIFHEAAVVFPFAPWALHYCETVLGKRDGLTVMLPCITAQDQIIAPQVSPPHFMTAFHLERWRLKNLPSLIEATSRLNQENREIRLNVFGGGSDEVVQEIEDKNHQLRGGCAKLGGNLPPPDIQQMMNRHAGFAMLSRRESYGMVFAEALLAGCPIIYPKGAAVDGYFDDMPFAIATQSDSIPAIVDAMSRIFTDQKKLKSELAVWQKSGAAERFQTKNITNAYRDGLRSAFGNKLTDPVS